jgi:hypothetical protein
LARVDDPVSGSVIVYFPIIYVGADIFEPKLLTAGLIPGGTGVVEVFPKEGF